MSDFSEGNGSYIEGTLILSGHGGTICLILLQSDRHGFHCPYWVHGFSLNSRESHLKQSVSVCPRFFLGYGLQVIAPQNGVITLFTQVFYSAFPCHLADGRHFYKLGVFQKCSREWYTHLRINLHYRHKKLYFSICFIVEREICKFHKPWFSFNT